MEIIKFNQNKKVNIPQYLKDKLAYKSFCFIDIETTGLSHIYNNIILIGLLIVNNDEFCVNQFFAESTEEELELLEKFIDVAEKIDYFISYNGYSFDIPFINNRCYKLGLNFEISSKQNIDIFSIIKDYKPFLDLDNLKLKTVEKYLGINRTDTISGKESVDAYKIYQKNKDYNLKKLILKHNYDDVYNLQYTLKILDILDTKTSFNINLCVKSKPQFVNIHILNTSRNHNYFCIQCSTNKLNLKNLIYYSENYTFKWIPKDGRLTINFEVKKSKLSDGKECYYINQYDYSFSKHIVDNTKYKLPKNILLVQYGNKVSSENLKKIIEAILNKSLE